MASRDPAIVGAVALLAFCLATRTVGQQRPAGCTLDALAGRWTVATRDSAQPLLLTGTIEFAGAGGQTHLVMTTSEGTQEDLDYPVDSLEVRRGIVRFRFAPLGLRVVGECRTADSIAARFTMPNPPFRDIRERITMLRVRASTAP